MAHLRYNQVAHVVYGIQLAQQIAQFRLNPCPSRAFFIQGINKRGQFNKTVNAGIALEKP